jgi:hypothetical protein
MLQLKIQSPSNGEIILYAGQNCSFYSLKNQLKSYLSLQSNDDEKDKSKTIKIEDIEIS